ncbi:hypothetical protein [Spiroplasma turonicum]|uniref:Lipoprotein n=1 Tax=Spiroplasma turonicum TaxID=216946 RepID=A0A0K1P5X7_9MOLU|nr:hypothetical protein [Spiroplasma turonicum]AKU79665.1 hypothetical protein STURON_00419 [Spiroplasma turonicum]ALX70685.1 hypothetical protein STURO_v1c04170 [Spiroplasma turonicum]
MKKLLSILGTLSLALFPTASILSCGSKTESNSEDTNEKDPEGNENKDAYAELLKQFQNEVNDKLKTYLEENNIKSNLLKHVKDTTNYKFLNQTNLKGMENTDDGIFTKEQLQNLNADIKEHILQTSGLKVYLSTITNNSSYSSIVDGIDNLFNDININENYKFKKQESQKTSKSISIADETSSLSVYTLDITINFKINYKDKDKQLTTFNSNNAKLLISLTDNDAITTYWDSFVKNISKLALNKGASVITSDDLNLNDKEDKFINNDDIIKNYVNKNNSIDENKGLSEKLIDMISSEEDFNKLKESLGAVIDFKEKQDVYSELTWLTSFYADSEIELNWENDGKKLFDRVFKMISEEKDQKLSGSNTPIKVESSIFDYLSTHVNEWAKSYKLNFDKVNQIDDDNIIFDDNDTEALNNIHNSVKFGTIKLKGLELKFTSNSELTLELPEFNIYSTYTIDNNEKIMATTFNIENSKTFKSIYFNLNNGINAYNKVFGTFNPENERAITGFTGINAYSSDDNEKNLWDTLDLFDKSVNNKWITSLIGLNLKKVDVDQLIKRNSLLFNGNQKNFDFTFKNFKSQWFLNYQFLLRENGLIFNKPKVNTKGEKSIDIIFKLDFMNVTFKTNADIYENFDLVKGKTFIEKK